ncbi:hypothetical protein ACEWY4_025874 [Coilia grayii]|uniref:Disks large-associated protein 5 n=1 Tax=Coilia grayii TaxID=363190 RepID=A0ABD1IU73_9TELE
MEARFAFLHQRDTSVSMLRLKMSRRRSQSQKENRERCHNLRRRLENVPEQDSVMQDVSLLEKSVAVHEGKVIKTKAAKTEVNSAIEDRKKMLARYKEAKELQKEKERREREKKGVFKCGVYQPQKPGYYKSEVPSKVKVTQEPVQSSRVTRSMRQPAPPQPLQQKVSKTTAQNSVPKKEAVERRALNTRGQARSTAASTVSVTTTAEPATKPTRPTRAAAAAKAKSDAKIGSVVNPKTRSTSRQQKVPSAAQAKEPKENRKEMVQKSEQKEVVVNGPVEVPPPQPVSAPEEEAFVQAEAEAESVPPAPPSSSFAPEGFVFQAPAGLPELQPASLAPSSAPAPSSASPPQPPTPASPPPTPLTSASPPQPPTSASPPLTSASPPASSSPQPPTSASQPPTSASSPPPAPSSPPPASSSPPPASFTSSPPSAASAGEGDCGPAAPPSGQQEEQHGVPYFRSVLVTETERLSELSEQWEPYFDDSSIPEEMRDRMRTAVGQARLLIKERFGQFSGLVDNCELKRGEKVTTCSDLQGFWDMVYFQVEDVDRKFRALKEAEGRGWTEEMKPAPRQRKVVKKPPAEAQGAASRPGAGAAAAAKSRLAAIKAAMKARQQQAEAEKAAQAAAAAAAAAATASAQDSTPAPAPAAHTPSKSPQPTDTIVFHGGFFQVESPAKAAGAVRRSSRLSAATVASQLATPSRHRRSHAPIHPSPLARRTPASTPARLPTASPACTPQPATPSVPRANPTPSLSFSPERPCPASPSQLSLQPAVDQSPRSSGAAPALNVSETPRPPPNLLVFSPSAEQNVPVADSHTSPAGAVRIPDADVEMTATPETSCTGDIPGLDFERYLQTTVASGTSPNDSGVSQAFSPMVMDAEMESPEAQREDSLLQTPTTLPRMSPLFTPQMTQPVDCNLLLFTPEFKNRVRQSVCERDLMSFTPPQ